MRVREEGERVIAAAPWPSGWEGRRVADPLDSGERWWDDAWAGRELTTGENGVRHKSGV